MTLRINDLAPDFEADTTEGRIRFHDWIGDGWAILFSHPKGFAPVCATELETVAGLKTRIREARMSRCWGSASTGSADHRAWSRDIEASQDHAISCPLVGDPELEVVKLYDMLPAGGGEHRSGAHADGQRHRPAAVFVTGPDKRIKATLT